MNRASDPRRPGPYRSRRGVFLGICRGLADYYDVPVFWVRLAAVALVLLTGIWPMIAFYVIAAFLLKKEPVVTFIGDSDREFYESYQSSRTLALGRLRRIYESLDRRIQRIEGRVTARDFDWDRRMSRP